MTEKLQALLDKAPEWGTAAPDIRRNGADKPVA
jgi:hypothetical protein